MIPEKTTEERYKMAFQLWSYAIQRMDLLIIAICGAGIYVVLQTLQFSIEKKNLPNLEVLKIAGAFFLFSIISNFISQMTGKLANQNDLAFRRMILDYTDEEREMKKHEMKTLDKKADDYTLYTGLLNTLSVILMFIGLLFEVGYFSFNL